MSNIIHCQGCGVAIQSDDPEAPGYVPASAAGRADAVCRRCYRITHYGEFSRHAVDPRQYEQEIAAIERDPGIVLYVLDVFDLAGSLASGFARALRRSEVHLVVNKVDLLPAAVDSDRLVRWIRDEAVRFGIAPKGVHFVSAQRGTGVEALFDWLTSAGSRTVYVVGMANVGKSTLLNRLHRQVNAEGRAPLTVSQVPGTTLGTVHMDWTLSNGRTLHVADTPGLIHGNRLTDYLCAACLKAIVPGARLKPRVFQLDPGQSLLFGNVARFDFVDGEHQSVACYVSNDLVIHRTKLDRADDIADKHADDILKRPCPACRQRLGPLGPVEVRSGRVDQTLDDVQMTLQVNAAGTDLVLPGLGWISLGGQAIRGTLWLPLDLAPASRPRLIGSLNRR